MPQNFQGSIFIARQVIYSEIFLYKPSDWFKIWIYILCNVSHADNKWFKRGEGLFNYDEIIEKCHTSRNSVKHCLEYLRQNRMIKTRRTTRGVIIFVLKYDYFQTLKNCIVVVKNEKKSRGITAPYSEIRPTKSPTKSPTKNGKNTRRNINKVGKKALRKAPAKALEKPYKSPTIYNNDNNDNKSISAGKSSATETFKNMKAKTNVELLVDYFFVLKGWDDQPKEFYKENKIYYGRFCKEAKELLTICDEDFEKAKKTLDLVRQKYGNLGDNEWVISTAVKKFFELKI